jgi:hypothetical protein
VLLLARRKLGLPMTKLVSLATLLSFAFNFGCSSGAANASGGAANTGGVNASGAGLGGTAAGNAPVLAAGVRWVGRAEQHPNYGQDPSGGCPFTTNTESAYQAYGPTAARAVNADASVLASSGWGIYSDNGGNTQNVIPLLFGNTVGEPRYSPPSSSRAWAGSRALLQSNHAPKREAPFANQSRVALATRIPQ